MSGALQNDVNAVVPAQVSLDDSLLAVKLNVGESSQLIEIAIRKHQTPHVSSLDPVHRVLVPSVTLLCQVIAILKEVCLGASQAKDPRILAHPRRLDSLELFIADRDDVCDYKPDDSALNSNTDISAKEGQLWSNLHEVH